MEKPTIRPSDWILVRDQAERLAATNPYLARELRRVSEWLQAAGAQYFETVTLPKARNYVESLRAPQMTDEQKQRWQQAMEDRG